MEVIGIKLLISVNSYPAFMYIYFNMCFVTWSSIEKLQLDTITCNKISHEEMFSSFLWIVMW